MKGLFKPCGFAAYATAMVLCCSSYSFGQLSDNSLTNKTLSLQLTDANFIYVLGSLAVEHRVPIGLEVAVERDYRNKLNINVSNEPLKNILDLIVHQEPAYRWELKDGVINFVPTQSRDAFISQLLDTRVSRFAPEKGINKFRLRDTLADLPEVKTLLDAHGMSVWRLGRPTYRSVYSNDEVDLSISDTDVRGVLNKVIRDSEHKLWVVALRRHSKNIINIDF